MTGGLKVLLKQFTKNLSQDKEVTLQRKGREAEICHADQEENFPS